MTIVLPTAPRALNAFFALRGVHVASLAADEGLIGLDFPRQLYLGVFLEGEPETLKHEPRALLGNPESRGQARAS